MKKMKKAAALSLVAAMTASMCLAGCGGNTKEELNGGASATESGAVEKKEGKITIFQSKTEIMDGLNELAQAYTDETGVEVEVWETSGDNYYADLKTNLATGEGPTVFSLLPGSESEEMSDYLEDLGDLSFVDKIGAGMADSIDGKMVGIPYTVEGFGLVYNNDLVNVGEMTSADALTAWLESTKAEGTNGLGLSQEDYFLIAHILNAAFAVQEEPDAYLQQVLNGETRIADNHAFVEFGALMEAVRANCTNPVDVTYDQNCGDFATGKTAMIHQGNWCYSMFADYEIDFDMGIAPVPVEGNTKLSVSVPIAWYVNTDAPEEEKALAKEFLEWLYTSETGKDYMMNKFGFIPVVEGMESEKLDPLSQSVAEAVASGNTIPWVMSDWPAGIVTTDLAPIARDFFTSDMTAEEFLNQLNDAFAAAAE